MRRAKAVAASAAGLPRVSESRPLLQSVPAVGPVGQLDAEALVRLDHVLILKIWLGLMGRADRNYTG
jgi:hypothetical protein